MPNIRPVSDLRNYASVLMEVHENEPVYLTKNGRGSYAIVDIKEYEDFEKTKASLKLMYELQKGKVAGETKGWLSEENVTKHFEEKFNA
ncbi:MAG: type II toxin-antitoxin system prevent-host-death family antitoxin [Treponema sp.]|nr:type II toxin-antitoxin system prevent-host-death family antitoxin [Treponema sp.]